MFSESIISCIIFLSSSSIVSPPFLITKASARIKSNPQRLYIFRFNRTKISFQSLISEKLFNPLGLKYTLHEIIKRTINHFFYLLIYCYLMAALLLLCLQYLYIIFFKSFPVYLVIIFV